MLRTSESETEILLGNKQLLGIFFVVALLLAVAFYGGYMMGRGGPVRKSIATTATQEETASTPPAASVGETHMVSAGTANSPEQNATTGQEVSGAPEERTTTRSRQAEQPLGSARHKATTGMAAASNTEAAGASASEGFAPQVGQQFLQVAAVSRDEAEAVADVLHKKGFRAHAVPKPGNPRIYRVIIGPIRDTADLSSTRESLVRTGFREVILQRY